MSVCMFINIIYNYMYMYIICILVYISINISTSIIFKQKFFVGGF